MALQERHVPFYMATRIVAAIVAAQATWPCPPPIDPQGELSDPVSGRDHWQSNDFSMFVDEMEVPVFFRHFVHGDGGETFFTMEP